MVPCSSSMAMAATEVLRGGMAFKPLLEGPSSPLVSSFIQKSSKVLLLTTKRRAGKTRQIWNCKEEPVSKTKRANLVAKRALRVPFSTYYDESGRPKQLHIFLSHSTGIESMINAKSLQSFDQLDNNTFRCTLPKIELLNFEAVPVVDLYVYVNEGECVVELLSCKFEGSEIVERQNERFSASMKNSMRWDALSQEYLDVNVELKVSLEVYTLPFTLLPLSAVEIPGNAVLQTLLDRFVPQFIDYLLENYEEWAHQKSDIPSLDTSYQPHEEAGRKIN